MIFITENFSFSRKSDSKPEVVVIQDELCDTCHSPIYI